MHACVPGSAPVPGGAQHSSSDDALGRAGGGLMGYIKKGSTTSLVASTAVSLLLFVSASLMGRPDQRIGSLLALGEERDIGTPPHDGCMQDQPARPSVSS